MFFGVSNSKIRCSNLGFKFFDDILGINFGNYECIYINSWVRSYSNVDDKDRFKDKERYSNTKNKKKVNCPSNSDIIILLGQSNAANHILTKKYGTSKDLNYFENNCYYLSDPVLGATNNMNSLLPSLSSKLKNNKPIIFISNGWSNTSITDWSKNDSKLTEYTRKNISELISNNNLTYIIWIQGESDSGRNVNYLENFKKFKSNLLRNFDIKDIKNTKFIVSQTSICGELKPIDQNLINQQRALKNIKNVFVTEVTDNLGFNYRYDYCHFNKFGAEIITDEIANIINMN